MQKAQPGKFAILKSSGENENAYLLEFIFFPPLPGTGKCYGLSKKTVSPPPENQGPKALISRNFVLDDSVKLRYKLTGCHM